MTKVETGKQPAKINAAQKNQNSSAALKMFMGAVLDMSWQLALVVLVPLIGGFELYKHNHGLLWLFIVGIVIAIGGSYAVIRRMYIEYGNVTLTTPSNKEKK